MAQEPKILRIDVIPDKCTPFSDTKKMCEIEQWSTLKEQYKKSYGGRCHYCTSKGTTKRGLEIHEVWSFDLEHQLQKLTNYVCLCVNCHLIKHLEYAKKLNYYARAIEQAKRVNHWSDKQMSEHEAWAEKELVKLNKIEWYYDISLIQEYLQEDKREKFLIQFDEWNQKYPESERQKEDIKTDSNKEEEDYYNKLEQTAQEQESSLEESAVEESNEEPNKESVTAGVEDSEPDKQISEEDAEKLAVEEYKRREALLEDRKKREEIQERIYKQQEEQNKGLLKPTHIVSEQSALEEIDTEQVKERVHSDDLPTWPEKIKTSIFNMLGNPLGWYMHYFSIPTFICMPLLLMYYHYVQYFPRLDARYMFADVMGLKNISYLIPQNISTHVLPIVLVYFAVKWFKNPVPYGEWIICKIGDLSWSVNAFCRGWLITGGTGSGKTQSGINIILEQLFINAGEIKTKTGKTKRHAFGALCIDEKGSYWEILKEIATRFGRDKDLCLLQVGKNKEGELPEIRYNLLSDHSIPENTYATNIIQAFDAAMGNEGGGGGGNSAFFKSKAESTIGDSLFLCRAIRKAQIEGGILEDKALMPSLSLIYDITQSQDMLKEFLFEHRCMRASKSVESQKKQNFSWKPANTDDELYRQSAEVRDGVFRLNELYYKQPKDQFGGVKTNIENYLKYFARGACADVFCRDNTFDLKDLDEGKLVCVALPQTYEVERKFAQCMLKLLVYSHARRRFDLPKKVKQAKNPIIICQDEFQRYVQSIDGEADILREARCTTVAATQTQKSLFPPMGGREKAEVLIANLCNRMIFKAADEDCAEMSAKFIGKKEKHKISKTKSSSGESTQSSKEEKFVIEPFKIRKLKDFNAIVCHSEGEMRRYMIQPIDEKTGKMSFWWNKVCPIVPVKLLLHIPLIKNCVPKFLKIPTFLAYRKAADI